MGIVALIVGPALFWACYHFYKDRFEPEPLGYLALAYLMGIGAGLLASWGYTALDWFDLRYDAFLLAREDLWGLWWYSILAIGGIEEACKMIPFLVVILRWSHFDQPLDGIIYSSFIALGFASHENLFWLPALAPWEAVGRSIASPLVHVMFASIWGYAISRARFGAGSVVWAVFWGLGLSAVLHGIFDFITIGLPHWVKIGPPVLILAVWVWRMHRVRDLQGQ